MNNPWKELPRQAPFLLTSDAAAILAFNQTANDDHLIRSELLPEPYLGNIEAPIVLLNLNPGFSKQDHLLYANPYGRESWLKNIRHEKSEYPFYLLDPRLEGFDGPKWWARKLRQPIELSDRKRVAKAICCIEYFPYHSKRYKGVGEILESQKYSFHLAKRAIERGALIVILHSEERWRKAVPELKDANVYRLNSSQNVALSANNCPAGFPLILKLLNS